MKSFNTSRGDILDDFQILIFKKAKCSLILVSIAVIQIS